jgi:hypothetical protein
MLLSMVGVLSVSSLFVSPSGTPVPPSSQGKVQVRFVTGCEDCPKVILGLTLDENATLRDLDGHTVEDSCIEPLCGRLPYLLIQVEGSNKTITVASLVATLDKFRAAAAEQKRDFTIYLYISGLI